jgi:hypothetical protein
MEYNTWITLPAHHSSDARLLATPLDNKLPQVPDDEHFSAWNIDTIGLSRVAVDASHPEDLLVISRN